MLAGLPDPLILACLYNHKDIGDNKKRETTAAAATC